MTPMRLVGAVAVSLVILAIASAAVGRLADHAPAHVRIEEILHARPDTCAIAIGNSLMDSGFDAAQFELSAASRGAPCRGLKAALGATLPVEHDILLNTALERVPRPNVVYYGWFDRQLTTAPAIAAGDLTGNRNVGLLLDPARVISLSDMDWRSRTQIRLLSGFSLYTERGQAWRAVELLRRRLQRLGTGPADSGKDPFTALEADSTAAFASALALDVRNHVPLSRPVSDIADLARRHGARVIFVLMPATVEHRTRFYGVTIWRRYVDYVSRMITAAGGEVCDASGWITDPKSFADVLHLNTRGSAQFSAHLATSCTFVVSPS